MMLIYFQLIFKIPEIFVVYIDFNTKYRNP